MPLSPKTYATVGRALYGRGWIYPLRTLLDVRKDHAEQIAHDAAHGLAMDLPDEWREPMRQALYLKLDECHAALRALEEQSP